MMAEVPLSHPGGSDQGKSSGMPMPKGLIPVGNAVAATRPGLPRPPSNALSGGTSTLAAVRS